VLTFWAYLRFRMLMWGLRMTGRFLRVLILAAVLVAAAPVTLVTAVGFAGAWLRGWPPARLWRAAAWALPMTTAYLAGRALHAGTWRAFVLAPWHDVEPDARIPGQGGIGDLLAAAGPSGVRRLPGSRLRPRP